MPTSGLPMAGILQDLRYGVRGLRRNPAFASVAVLSLAIGIAATVAICSVLDAVAVRPLPVRDPQRLALIQLQKPNAASASFSYPLFRRVRSGQNVLQDMMGSADFDFCAAAAGNRVLANPACRLVTRNYFQVLGARPARGRFFDERDAAPVVVISHRLWQREFGGAPDIVGAALRVNGAPMTVAAVAPPEFFGESAGTAPDLYVPVDLLPRLAPGIRWLESERSYWLWAIGRLKPGVSLQDAEAALARLNPSPSMRIRTESGAQGLDHLRRQYGYRLRLLAAAACLLLLVACANTANLLLARGAGRQREIAIRQAVGAGSLRIARQLLTESLLLSVVAGALAIPAALAASRLLIGFVSLGGQPVRLTIGPDARVLGFTLALCLATTLLLGLVPALRAGRIDLSRAISSGWLGRRGSGKRLSGKALVAFQAALSVVLIAATALLVRSLGNLRSLDPGFVSNGVSTAQLSFVPTRDGLDRLVRLGDPLAARLRSIPGVHAAALSTYPILSTGWQSDTVALPGRPPREGEIVHVNQVTSGFFETYRIGLVRGRTLSAADSATAPRAAVINERLARQYFGAQDPVGRQIALGSRFDPRDAWTIVGVVRNTKYHDLREEMPPQIYCSLTQAKAPGIFIGVRAASNRTVTPQQLRAALAEVDPSVEIRNEESLAAHVEATLEKERLMARLGVVFGVLALTLACAGVYGTMAYSVARRTKEIGLRMALGAAPFDVRNMVLREALLPASAGLAAGLPLAFAAVSVLRSVLFGIGPAGPAVLAAAASTVLASAMLAAWLPARWASRVDPMTALRSE